MAVFTGNPELLISAAMIQDFIIGKNAQPLAAGIITMTHDNAPSVLKPWYQQIGPQGGPYTYVTLPNPMTLTGVGTMADGSGNDIIPFYYPWADPDPANPGAPLAFDPYLVTVTDSNETLQFTRSYFPWVPDHGAPPTPGTGQNTNENYIINNRFWRNLNTIAASQFPTAWPPNTWTNQYNLATTVYYQTLAPSQHDGFSMPDFNYIRNTQGSGGSVNESITFNTFPQPLSVQTNVTGDIGPEFYLNFTCVSDATAPTLKIFQFPITLHLATLVNEPFSFTIQGRSNSGPAQFNVYIYKFLGTGVESDDPILIGNVRFTSTTFIKQNITGQLFPSTAGDVLGSAGTGGNDDAYYIQIAMPPGAVNVDFTLPSLYLVETQDELPDNNFQTYDQIDSVIAAARTGDIKTSVNPFYPFGWAPMNDGTIAHPNTGVTVIPPAGLSLSYQGFDAWALYNMLWNLYSPYKFTSTASLLPIYTAAGNASTYGTNAWIDWNALKQLKLTKMLGQVILGTVPASALTLGGVTFSQYLSTFTATTNVLTPAHTMQLFNGMPVYFTGTTTLALNTIYYVGLYNGTTFSVYTTFALAIAGGTPVTVATDSGTVIAALPASYEGEYAHTQLEGELARHNHPGSTSTTGQGGSGSGAGALLANTGTGTPYTLALQIANDGSSTPFNVTQPGTFFNMFIKL
jgi:hypothetical protein